jgi:hypothetical protein
VLKGSSTLNSMEDGGVGTLDITQVWNGQP